MTSANTVVVLIFSHKAKLEWYEKISFEQCYRVLGNHTIRLVCPERLDLAEYKEIRPDLNADFIPGYFMNSIRAYNRLKILPWLYRRYAKFDYILTYELDAFVFRDELLNWCNQGWDYIGAPWFEGYNLAKPDAQPCGVGNSGFSLRRTSSMLRVLRTWRYLIPPRTIFRNWRQSARPTPRSIFNLIDQLVLRNNFFAFSNDFDWSEDIFWCDFVGRRFPWFRIAPYEVARHFSFEVNSPRLFRENGSRLPFGCHKWNELNIDFWYPVIQSFDHEIPRGYFPGGA